MAEGTAALFTNFRTGEQLTIASGIVTGSIALSKLENIQPQRTLGRAFGTATGPPTELTRQQTVAIITSNGADDVAPNKFFSIMPYVGIDGVMEVGRYIDFHHLSAAGTDFNARLLTDGTTNHALFITSAGGGQNKIVTTADLVPVHIASGTLTGTSVSITNIPQNFSALILTITSMSFSTTAGAAHVQLSTDNGATYDSTAGNYSLFAFTGIVAVPSMLVPVNPTTAGDSIHHQLTINGYQINMLTRSDGHSLLIGVGSQKTWGLYVGSTASVDALKIISNTATSSFDNGIYRLHGVY